MDANVWLWIALIAFLVFCCLPMFFMGRRSMRPNNKTNDKDDKSLTGVGDKQTVDWGKSITEDKKHE